MNARAAVIPASKSIVAEPSEPNWRALAQGRWPHAKYINGPGVCAFQPTITLHKKWHTAYRRPYAHALERREPGGGNGVWALVRRRLRAAHDCAGPRHRTSGCSVSAYYSVYQGLWADVARVAREVGIKTRDEEGAAARRHPERKRYARGLCSVCYQREYQRTRRMKAQRNAQPHTEAA